MNNQVQPAEKFIIKKSYHGVPVERKGFYQIRFVSFSAGKWTGTNTATTTDHNVRFTVSIHPQRKRDWREWNQMAGGDMNIEIPLKSSCVLHLCESDAERLLCLCNLWSGLGWSVNMQRHNAALLRPAMVWVAATIMWAVGGWQIGKYSTKT